MGLSSHPWLYLLTVCIDNISYKKSSQFTGIKLKSYGLNSYELPRGDIIMIYLIFLFDTSVLLRFIMFDLHVCPMVGKEELAMNFW